MTHFFRLIAFLCLSSIYAGAAVDTIDPLFLTGKAFSHPVRAMAGQPDGKLIVGGSFTSIVGAKFNRLARLRPDGSLDLTFNVGGSGANGDVLAILPLPDGRIVIGGSFTSFNGTTVGGLARLLPDGGFDASFNMGSGVEGTVHQLLLQPDGKLLVAGGFTAINGVPSKPLARLLSDGTIDSSFVFTGNVEFTVVKALALQPDGKILFGGFFFDNSFPFNAHIARVDASGNMDSTFVARTNQISPTLTNTPVVSIAERNDGKILIGGKFTTVNNIANVNVALLNANGSLDASFVAATTENVSKAGFRPDGKVILTGLRFDATFEERIVTRLNKNGSIDNTFLPTEVGDSPFVANTFTILPDDQLFIGGLLSWNPVTIGGAQPGGVAKLNSDGTRDFTFKTLHGGTDAGAAVKLVLTPDQKIVFFAGGFPPVVGGLQRRNLARLNTDGTVDPDYNPPITGTAITVMLDGSILLGGYNDPANGAFRFFRKILPNGTVDPSFSVQVGSPSNPISNVAIQGLATQLDGKVVVVGDFNSIGGVTRKSIARLMPDGTVDQGFDHSLSFQDANITRVRILPNGKIWVTGRLLTNFNFPATVRLSSTGTVEIFLQTFNDVYDIAPMNDGRVYICGAFTSVQSNTNAKYVARLDPNGFIDPTFVSPDMSSMTSGLKAYRCHAQRDGKVIVGGDFTNINGVTTRRIFARLNIDGSFDTSFFQNPIGGFSPVVSSIVEQPDGRILIGGTFTSFDGVPHLGMARIFGSTLGADAPFDFDGDGKTDLGIFRPTVGEWWYRRSSDGLVPAFQFGASTDKIAPADFTGDGKTDIAFFRPSTGEWYILRSENNSFFSFPFGASEDIPVPADYDADGKADPAVFRPLTATWYIQRSSDNGTTIAQFGATGDHPVAADYDGDGEADLAIYRPSNGQWWLSRSTGGVIVYAFGDANDKPVQGDYTGDGKADVAFWRPSTGEWYILRSEDTTYYSAPFGISTDIPAPGDYDGDGKFDTTVFRPSNTNWYSQRTTAGTLIQQFGATGDQPIPNAFVP